MQIVPKEAKISLYEEGFGENDLLDRKVQGEQLSDLIERIADPLVICLDGQWGSGKSYFLKRWVGAHTLENGGTAKVVYFDAFRDDFLDDPLIGLVSAISKRFDTPEEVKGPLGKARAAAAILWRPALRVGVAAASAGASEAVGKVADAAIDEAASITKDRVTDFWKKEDGKRGAMAQFRGALKEIVTNDDDVTSQKLVVVVDELDRCRPDYALSVLEVIKHFFDVDGIHFVLGLNSVEFENIVSARYGLGVDAKAYLQKFVDVTLTLPDSVAHPNGAKSAALVYLNEQAEKMALNAKLIETVNWHITNFKSLAPRSLREAVRLLTEMALIPQAPHNFEELHFGYQFLISGLLVQKQLNPSFYQLCRRGAVQLPDVAEAFGTEFDEDPSKMEHSLKVLHRVWASCLSPKSLKKEDGWQGMWGTWGLNDPERVIPRMFTDYLDVVRLTNANP